VSAERAILVTLVGYQLVLLGIGWTCRARTRDGTDFFLGGRRLGPLVSAIGASASSSSAWTLLGVSGAAYAWGWPALWLFPATVGGFLVNWFWVAPRLKSLAGRENAVTLASVLAPQALGESRQRILRTAGVIIVFSFVFYVASQFEAAGKAFESVFGLGKEPSILVGSGIVLAYTLLGGFWAVSVTDTIQGLLMSLAAIVLPIIALAAVGGPADLVAGLAPLAGLGSPVAGVSLAAGVVFVLGILGIGIGYPGQPHVVNRFMALRDEKSLRQGRVIAIGWAVVVYAGMLTLGLCARVLYADLGDAEQVLFHAAGELLPAVIAGVMLAAVLSAIMSTADSQLLVAASAISHDWTLARGGRPATLRGSRLTVLAVLVAATALALVWQADIFSRVLFAWAALGAAFGPILIVRLTGRRLSAGGTLGAMLTGFLLTVAISWLPDAPGDAAERVLPFVAAMVVAALSAKPGSPQQAQERLQPRTRAGGAVRG